jgi:hypothetical protein
MLLVRDCSYFTLTRAGERDYEDWDSRCQTTGLSAWPWRLEKIPEAVMDEVLARVAPIFE